MDELYKAQVAKFSCAEKISAGLNIMIRHAISVGDTVDVAAEPCVFYARLSSDKRLCARDHLSMTILGWHVDRESGYRIYT